MKNDQVIAIDYEKCTGCRICEIVCSIKNSGVANPVKSRIRIVKAAEEGDSLSIPVVCMKCVEPACKAVCPMSAISDDPDTGARIVDKEKCIGCSACVYACPFGVIAVDRSQRHSITCHQCDGKPTCVEFCPRGTIQYVNRDEVGVHLRRARMEKFTEFIKGDIQ